ncbi:hypothetical protein LHV13_03265 [Ferrovum sp. PN-J185]|uniref:hypothetical protein n=1 Tax=Ferrovum sp. PN-J185 TaxID=1356306 RepID=UPI00079C9B71|nr:hypothetical protein [Ferrovum sp. PN-J185]KXW56456.1 hypothetical protein FV185_04050 [Ferrovum sp. PN-J185]MCC6068195.1 hypothetical protein [Ferrovum sp. PN-J185]MDE1891692.1 hypothetical protein [Betaproteobacteria bacterium]MDE2056466.1 hypothetical protein [Betaproteobacteria bacterium]
MIRKTADTSYNPQPQPHAPINLPKDLFSQQLWLKLRYISPKNRLIIIKFVYEGLSSSLVFHWYHRRQKLNRYETYIAIRPILDRSDNYFLKKEYKEISLVEFKTKDPIMICKSCLPLKPSSSIKNS